MLVLDRINSSRGRFEQVLKKVTTPPRTTTRSPDQSAEVGVQRKARPTSQVRG
jgi:hypothetical protein